MLTAVGDKASFRRKIGPGNDAAQAESPPSSAKPTQVLVYSKHKRPPALVQQFPSAIIDPELEKHMSTSN
eukprot:4526786-Amphidinium_carterae.1